MDDRMERVLKDLLRQTAGQKPRIPANPVEAAKYVNSTLSEMVPLVSLFAGNDRAKFIAYTDAIMALVLDDFKKAVVEETIAGQKLMADALGDVLRKAGDKK